MRKIKLMALLLATLMIVAAFAGCAGVKKEELDALDVRVQALEDLLNGQQKDLEEIKRGLEAVDNTEILEAIESVKTDLEDKIKDVNDRVDDEVGKADTPVAGVDAATKAEQQKALALIEVKRAEFSKAADEYSEEDYKKISEALGTATGAVNAATTVDAVKAAMTALDSELAKYMTYAMKAYDYYCKLLGNVNADAGDLVEEAKDFLKEVKAVFGTEDVEDFEGKVNGASVTNPDAYIAEVYYLVSEGSKPAKDEYIDVYNAISDLCTLYTSKTGTKDIPYIDEDGDIDIATLKTVKAYTAEAEDLVERINEELGENFVYCEKTNCSCNYCTFGEDDGLYATYEAFVENATLLGGEKLAKLVTNADEIIAAEDTFKLLEEAAEAFEKATKLKAGKYDDLFYYYDELTDKGALETVGANGKDVWAADEYEKVADLLADWIADYELSEDNILAIIAAKKGSNYYTSETLTTTYVYNAHKNALLVEAFNSFKAIAEKIADLNEVSEASIDMVLAYDEIEELFAEYVVLQEETDDDEVEYPANLEITLDVDNFKTIVAEADLFDKFSDERLAKAFTGKDMDDFLDVNGLIDLYTFEADVDQLEDDKTYNEIYFDVDKNDKVTDNREHGDIYVFLTDTYDDIKAIAKAINTKIEDLVDDVAAKKLATNEGFITLEGKYIAIPDGETFESNDVVFDSTDSVLVLYTDIYTKAAERDAYFETFKTVAANAWTIEAFKAIYPEFESMLDIAEFDAAKKTMADRMETLFTDAQAVVDLVDDIDYVRTDDSGKAYVYTDVNKNGKYDADDAEEAATLELKVIDHLVSLNDKAAVDTAWNKYDAWVKLGGAVTMKKFANYVEDDETFDDVYYMEPLVNPSEVRDAIVLVRELDAEIGALEAQAANFVAVVKNVKAVDAATAFTVNLDTNRLNTSGNGGVASNSVQLYAWTKFTAATNDAARDNDGTYTIINKTSPWKTESYKTDCYDDQIGNVGLAANAWTKVDLLKEVQKMYTDFYFANVEYVADAKNNYEDDKDDYYQAPEYVAYAAVTTAVADYAKYDLASVKGYILSVYNTDSSAEIRSLRKQINAATTMEDVESILYAYVAEYGDDTVDADALNAYAIYDFARLASLNLA